MAARMALADLPLSRFLEESVVPFEDDEVTRLILDTHDKAAFAPVAHLTVGDFRDWLLSDGTDSAKPFAALATRADARNGRRGFQADAQPGPRGGGEEMPGHDALSQHHRAFRGGLASACSRTTPPTTPRASLPRCSTACSTAAGMR